MLDPYLLSVRVTETVASHAQPVSASPLETSEASVGGSTESIFLYPLIEVEALEDSASCPDIKRYEKEEYEDFLQRKETVIANAAAAA